MPSPKLIAKNRSEYGQSAVDLYTPLHFSLGFVAGVSGISPIKAALFFTVVKLAVASAEHGLGHALMRRVPGESNINELCDLLAEIGGIQTGARVRAKWNPSPQEPCVCDPCPGAAATSVGPAAPHDPTPSPAPASPVSGIFRR